ncbi:NADPH-dependent FMN reductase [Cellulomonas chengniuliangii]|uniref:NADPH-dependent FMN reductase n=1 Tax=Cellulomonas chengniuliangii TaxID=2968084 RepID=UPI001D0DCD68|nr:NAD(P)H-dependent oxidoreductase [Cellulomonas chengniuliangii]MCC2317772.1 NAD(P)H-dependent oxidoreductase [Cellulomonas chengniuliangii]
MTTSAVTPTTPATDASSASRSRLHVLAVVGNPRPGSRTRVAAESLSRAIAQRLGGGLTPTVELANLAPELFTPTRPAVDDALRRLASAHVAVVATPVYKASYTGLLKAFLDLYGPDGLRGVVAVPLVVSGSPAHSLAGEVHLRPLLVELGASVPTRALALTEAQLADLDEVVATWVDAHGPLLDAAAVRA